MDQECNQGLIFHIDGIAFSAREMPDLSWLPAYGRVFRVLDQQLSGNLCFGVEGKYGRLFIKYAGARTLHYTGHPHQAIETLKNAMPLYQRAHPSLTKLLGHGPTREGYAAIFAWQDAQPLYAAGPTPALSRVRRISWASALAMLEGLFDLQAQLADEGYVAVDFSEDNILIDFTRDRAILCDIDLYKKKPLINDRGKMPGLPRLMAPEEYQPNASLDDGVTVYHMGMLAFSFFGDVQHPGKETWHGPDALYPVAEKAINRKREKRYPSARAFLQAWREAVAISPL